MVWPAACCIFHTVVWYIEGLFYLFFFSPPILVSDDFDAVLSVLVGHTTATQRVLFRVVKPAAAFIDCVVENKQNASV